MNIPRPLSRTTLKFIALISMLLDHIGFFLFPKVSVFRMLGRLAFPIFAFFIADGVRYTRSRLKYFLRIATLGILCQIPALFQSPSAPLNIFVTFSISILIIYLFDWLKNAKGDRERLLSAVVNILALAVTFILSRIVVIEYGFAGILFAPLSSIPRKNEDDFRDLLIRLAMTIPAFLILSVEYIKIFQPLSLLSIPLLLLYSGKPGKYPMKYFFYIFYPAHLVLLYYIAALIK